MRYVEQIMCPCKYYVIITYMNKLLAKLCLSLIIAGSLLAYQTQARDRVDSNNAIGFLGGGYNSQSWEVFTYSGAGWVRPHLGPAIWGNIQKKKNGNYNWKKMDSLVKNHQRKGANLLITIWPFAGWDQKNRNNAADCKVSDDDVFAGELPLYRCNPDDWKEYREWVIAMVERYDGDGKKDMKDLRYGVQHWEVMNEPDLAVPNSAIVAKDDNKDEAEDNSDSLDFYSQGPDEYYTLLKKSSSAIRQADQDSRVVIAGAAGGSDQFLDFYDEMFSSHPMSRKYFDIGNIHCIQNDYYNNFNVAAYNRLLKKYKMRKPIWVTEADAFIGETPKQTYNQIYKSTRKGQAAGGDKFFYTGMNFGGDKTNKAAWNFAKKKFKKIVDDFAY